MRIISFSNTLDVDVLVLKIKYFIPKYQIYRLSSLDSRFGTWGVGVRLKYMPVGVGVRNP